MSKPSGSLGAALARAIRWARPRARALLVAGAATLVTALRALGRAAWARRGVVVPLGARCAWWGALALLFIAGRPLFDSFADPSAIERAPTLLWTGLVVCALLTFAVRENHLRWPAAALGVAHGTLAWMTVATQLA